MECALFDVHHNSFVMMIIVKFDRISIKTKYTSCTIHLGWNMEIGHYVQFGVCLVHIPHYFLATKIFVTFDRVFPTLTLWLQSVPVVGAFRYNWPLQCIY